MDVCIVIDLIIILKYLLYCISVLDALPFQITRRDKANCSHQAIMDTSFTGNINFINSEYKPQEHTNKYIVNCDFAKRTISKVKKYMSKYFSLLKNNQSSNNIIYCSNIMV
jgi:hypothetical protein